MSEYGQADDETNLDNGYFVYTFGKNHELKSISAKDVRRFCQTKINKCNVNFTVKLDINIKFSKINEINEKDCCISDEIREEAMQTIHDFGNNNCKKK